MDMTLKPRHWRLGPLRGFDHTHDTGIGTVLHRTGRDEFEGFADIAGSARDRTAGLATDGEGFAGQRGQDSEDPDQLGGAFPS